MGTRWELHWRAPSAELYAEVQGRAAGLGVSVNTLLTLLVTGEVRLRAVHTGLDVPLEAVCGPVAAESVAAPTSGRQWNDDAPRSVVSGGSEVENVPAWAKDILPKGYRSGSLTNPVGGTLKAQR